MYEQNKNHFDVLIIGAGISGISAAYHIQTECPDRTFAILEGRQNIGGTWDLFKYPGIRSDSDMYTLGFSFRPWTDPKAIADAPSIMSYLKEAVEDYQLGSHIHYGTKVLAANWSSEKTQWELTTQSDTGEERKYTANFVFGCTGYYNYDQGYTPDFKGMDQFKGQIIHPQKWPEDLEYTNKKMVVIGSGATAITLIPSLAAKAAHVTMLQRSPTYIVSAPAEDNMANFFYKYLPSKTAYSLTRWKKITMGRFSYWLCKRYPQFMGNLMIGGVKKELEDAYDIEKHFTPKYNPWDQRVCLAPDSDFFESLKSGKATVVTDHIDSFTEKGILLQSGEELEADIIVTATGLTLLHFGGIDMQVDSQPINKGDLVTYKGMMFSGLPNLALAFGYTNASWTLKCDLTSKFVARLLNYMSENGYSTCHPVQDDPNLELIPFVDFNSSYILRHVDELPKQGKELPWKLKQNYFADRKMIGKGKLDDGFLKFTKMKKQMPVEEVQV